MSMKVEWDFSRLAVLEHVIEATGTFTGAAERGRATATRGSSDAVTRVAASRLGAYANAQKYLVRTATGSQTVVTQDFDGLAVQPASGATANDVIDALNAFDPSYGYAYSRPWMRVKADAGAGTGASAVGVGATTFTGGLDPTEVTKGWCRFSSDADAGLFVFNHDEPLELVQYGARLGSSVAWTMTLRPLSAAFADLGTSYPIAGSTDQNLLGVNPRVLIPVGWGVGFTANAQGRAWVGVRAAR